MLFNNKKYTKKISKLLVLITISNIFLVPAMEPMMVVVQAALNYVATSKIATIIGSLVEKKVQISTSKLFPDVFTVTPSDVSDRVPQQTPLLDAHQNVQTMYLPTASEVGTDLKDRASHVVMDQLSEQAYKKVEAEVCNPGDAVVVQEVTHAPVTKKADLELGNITSSVERSIKAKQKTAIESYWKELHKKFFKESQYTISKSADGITIVSPNGKGFLTIQPRTVDYRVERLGLFEQYVQSLIEFRHVLEHHPEYKQLVSQQLESVLQCMTDLTSKDPCKRYTALIQLDSLQLVGPIDRYLQQATKEILKGYVQSDGNIPWQALTKENNYVGPIIQKFIDNVQHDIGRSITLKKLIPSTLNTSNTSSAYSYPISRGHNIWQGIKEHCFHQSIDYGSLMQDHELYGARLECVKLCQQYDFSTARKMLQENGNDKIMHYAYDHFYVEFQQKVVQEQQRVLAYQQAMFDSQGFIKSGLDNPLYKNLSSAERDLIASSPTQLDFFNKRLLAQLSIKDSIMKSWDIPVTASKEVHEAVYKLIGEDARLLSNSAELIDALADLSKDSSDIRSAFFLPNGVIKDFALLSRAKTLPVMPMTQAYNDMRYVLNSLIYIEQHGSPAVASHATEVLNAYASHGYVTNPVDMTSRFQRAIQRSINARLRELGVKTVEEGQQKITREAALAAVKKASAVVGTVAAGAVIFNEAKSNQSLPKTQNGSQAGAGSQAPMPSGPQQHDPNEDKNLYEDAGYHLRESNGRKSKAPKNGQRALDNSIQIKDTSPQRIAVDDGEFVVLSKTRDRLYHGHVREWDDLTDKMQRVLEEAGLVNGRGKIIK
ncbi:MAG: hypothetical protein NTX86_06150 [Candidatus Dependentiae bacterium]|nr:hypothetical protein [Candidatus Dependentiae bacterium]